MTEPLCTCGKRPKHKCCEESEHEGGKMCLKEFEAVRIPDELLERIKVLQQKAEDNKEKEL